MNDKILLSVLLIGLVVVSVTGVSTLALFHDEEVSKDNTFQAGKLDLTLDINNTYYNGDVPAFFEIDDVKPGDEGEETISYHVSDNDACVSFRLESFIDYENGCSEPEENYDISCNNPGEGEGELDKNLLIRRIWKERDGDNVYELGEEELVRWERIEELIDKELDLGYTEASEDYYLGIEWEVPSVVGNEIQTDSIIFEIIFNAVQERNNPECNKYLNQLIERGS